MTMNKRRSLFVTGCLMVAFVVFASKATFAQAPDLVANSLEVDARSHDELSVEWEWVQGATDITKGEEFSLRYQAVTTGVAFDTTKSITRMDVELNANESDDYRVTLEGLKPSTRYLVEVTPVGVTGVADGTAATAAGETDDADAPDDVRNLVLTAGDMMIMAMWDEATDNGSEVTGYQVQIKEADENKSEYEDVRSATDKDTSTSWVISNLENGMEYSVRVRASSHGVTDPDGWSDTEMAMPMAGAGGGTTPTPTPALPLFGAFALGAGVLAAGRARLRRREQRQLTR